MFGVIDEKKSSSALKTEANDWMRIKRRKLSL